MYRARNAARHHEECGCTAELAGEYLVVDATGCPADGTLADSPACRATVVTALGDRMSTAVLTRTDDAVYRYGTGATGLLVAAGRFAALATDHDAALARCAHYDPLGTGRTAVGRPDPIARIAAETGLAAGAHRVSDYDDALAATRHTVQTRHPPPGTHTPSANATHVCGWPLPTTMLQDIADAGELPPDELRARYHQRLRTAIHDAGIETVADDSGVDRDTLAALDAGDSPDSLELTTEDAAAILATREGAPDAETILTELRDHLLLGMTTAVLDVEALESEIDGRLDAREIQQKIEGRLPMSLHELALFHTAIEERKP